MASVHGSATEHVGHHKELERFPPSYNETDEVFEVPWKLETVPHWSNHPTWSTFPSSVPTMLQPALLFSAIQWSMVISPASRCMPQEYLGNRSLAPSRHQLALRTSLEGPDIVGPL